MDESSSLSELLESSPEFSSALNKVKNEIYRVEKDKIKAAELLAEAIGESPNRPKGWRTTTNAAYYKEKYARLVKKYLLQMDPSKGDILIKSKMFRVSRKSLREMISQGWIYLMEKDEEAERWKDMRNRIQIDKAADGIMLAWKTVDKVTEIEASFVPHRACAETTAWKDELDEFVMNGEDGKKLIIEGLRLNEDQIEYVKSICEQAAGIFPKDISSNRLELIKNVALWKRMQE